MGTAFSTQSNHESGLHVARSAPCCVYIGMNSPDEVLVTHAKVGDRDAFTTLFLRYKGEIYTCLMQLVHDDDIARELWQDTYLKAWSRIQSLKKPSSFKPWVITLTKNLAIDWLRRNSQKRTSSLEENGNTPHLIDENADPQRIIERDFVQSVLVEMDPTYRNVLLLIEHGYSRAEIAQQLKFTESTVTTYLCRAREEFRRLYQKMSHTDDGSGKEKNGAGTDNASKPESLDEEGDSPNENRKEI